MVNPVYQQDEELLLNPFGSRYLASGEYTDVNSNEFVVQEDTVISVLTGGDVSISENSIDYKASMNLSGVTLKSGALIVAPVGEAFKSITIDSGSIMAYNCVVGGTKPSGSVPLLLDDYPNAAAAYSLRKLRTDYAGAAIQARVDIPETDPYDIGFDSNGELDIDDLLSKAAGNDAYVSPWYDQANANDQVQINALNQPQIVDLGSIITQGGLPITDFNPSMGMGTNSSVSLGSASELWFFIALDITQAAGSAQIIFESSPTNVSNNGSVQISISNDSLFVSQNRLNNRVVTNVPIITGYKLVTIRMVGGQTNESTADFYINGVKIDTNLAAGNTSPDTYADYQFFVGARNRTSLPFIGKIQEFIVMTGNQSANREAIETNINNYYTIY